MQKTTLEQVPSHYFDWSRSDREPPFTTDPRHHGKLTYGRHNQVFVDGQELTSGVCRFITGPNGWVEQFAEPYEYAKNGNPRRIVIQGHVEYRDSRRVEADEPIHMKREE